MADTERESVDAANQFLANCYINGIPNGALGLDAERSPVFDQWSVHYLEHTKISESDIMILNGRGVPESGEIKALNAKMIKLELIEMLQGNAFTDMDIHYEWTMSEATKDEIAYPVLFEMKQMENMEQGDYELTFHSSVEFGYAETVLEHMKHRTAIRIHLNSANHMKENYQDMKTDMEKYYKERGVTFAWNIAAGNVIEGFGKLAPVIGVEDEALSFYADTQEALRKNAAIDSAVTRDM